MDENKTASSARQLALITEQRAALEKVVKISLAITRLQSGLESMLILGQDTSAISNEHLETFHIISNSIKHLPSDKLRQAIKHLDSYINTALMDVMALVEQGEQILQADNINAEHLQELHNDIHVRLNTFRRKSQTAVVVRLLLRKRGFNSPAFKLPIPEDLITSKIVELEGKEINCRQRIGNEIDIMERYVDNILASEELPESLREEMLEVKNSLQENRQHLLAGKPIEELPIVFEIVEMGESKVYDLGSDSIEDETTAEETPGTPEQSTQRVKQNILVRTWKWISSPMDVHWKDIDKYK